MVVAAKSPYSEPMSLPSAPLAKLLPETRGPESADPGWLLDRFLEFVRGRGIDLYPAQEEAILALFEGQNVILNTPTGSGKSLVATALHFQSVAAGRRSVYTCPIKALVNEKFLALCADFGPDLVGMATGDATVNRDAPILCCTAEILTNLALREGASAAVDDIIMDEFHYYSDRDRGVAWQVPLLTLSYGRFLLMSATLGDMGDFVTRLESLTGRGTSWVRSSDRPVPLTYVYDQSPLHETIKSLVFGGKAPVYLVCFTQRECAEEAQSLTSIDVCSKEEKQAIAATLVGADFRSPYGKEVQKLLRHGIGLHHAGLLPKYRLLVERLAQQGLLKVIVGTDTLGVGVNIPIRTVLFTKLCKFDGNKTTILSVRDFKQISGRAGRKGFDTQGTVVVQAPEHVIQNQLLESKAAGDPKKLRKLVKKKPPDKGYVHWDEATFKRLVESAPEPLISRFQVSHAMLLNTLGRSGDGCGAMRQLVRDCHETEASKRHLRRNGFALFRSLVERGIISIVPLAERDSHGGQRLKLNVDLQEDFSLNHALSLWLLDGLAMLTPEDPDHALDVLTLVEAILENPDLILRRQLDKLKGERLAELKAAGVEYEERLAELEKVEIIKPKRDFIYDTFNAFAARHPWVGQDNVRPKSIARDMYEQFMSFEEYVRDYDLQRAEGILLRYLSETYKVLSQTVPEMARTDELMQIIDYIGAMVRRVDASLLEEWERMRRPGSASRVAVAGDDQPHEPADVTRNLKAFTAAVRNEAHRLMRALAARDYGAAEAILGAHQSGDTSTAAWTAERLEAALTGYFAAHERLATGREARDPALLRWERDSGPVPKQWRGEQILSDGEGPTGWRLELTVDLVASRAAHHPVIALADIVSA